MRKRSGEGTLKNECELLGTKEDAQLREQRATEETYEPGRRRLPP